MRDQEPKDARLEELDFLARLERGSVEASIHGDALLSNLRTKHLILHLLREGYVNGIDSSRGGSLGWSTESGHQTRDWATNRQWVDIGRVLEGQSVSLCISHRGRVRIAELRDELRSGKYRDPSGLLWSVRHLDRDLAVALLAASEAAPVSLTVVDMNGLKAANDGSGYAAGNALIEAYLGVISAFTGDGLDGYRGDGSDEVYLVAHASTAEKARKTAEAIIARLAEQRVLFKERELRRGITACCGIETVLTPAATSEAVREKAEERLRGAKARSKLTPERESIIADRD
jgi:GGDEF domain-containing protein